MYEYVQDIAVYFMKPSSVGRAKTFNISKSDSKS